MSKLILDNEPIIFTNGAFLKPIMVTDSSGKEIWLWAVSEFVESSYFNGKEYNPQEFSNTKEELLLVNEEV